MLWTKATWSQYKLRFPLPAFGARPPAKSVPPDNSTGADASGGGASGQQPEKSVQLRIPADVKSARLERQLRGYDAVSLGGAVIGSGTGVPHEELLLDT